MGGLLSPTHTMNTALTPTIAKDALVSYQTLIYGWNRYLERNGMKKVSLGKPVGSTMHINHDLIYNPSVQYGDIDYLIILPFPINFNDDWTSRKLKESILEKQYLKSFEDYISFQNDEKIVASLGSMIVMQTKSNHLVQIDMITTFPLYFEWMLRRYGPERGKKGYLYGCLYSALGEELMLSFGTKGVQAKIQNGARVNSKKRKNIEIEKISVNPVSFLSDTLYYLTEQYSNALFINDNKLSSLIYGVIKFSSIFDNNFSHITSNRILKKYEHNLWSSISKKEKIMNKKGLKMSAEQMENYSFDVYAVLSQYEGIKNNL